MISSGDRQYARYAFLIDTIRTVSATLDPSIIASRLAERIIKFFGVDGVNFFIIDSARKEWDPWQNKQIPYIDLISPDELARNRELRIIIENQELLIFKFDPDSADHLSEASRNWLSERGVSVLWGLPVIREGEPVGACLVWSRSDKAISQDDLLLLNTVISLASNFIANALTHAQMREVAEGYRSLIDHIKTALLIIQNERIRFANEGASQLSGYSISELLGMPYIDLIVPEYRERLRKSYLLLLNGGNVPESSSFWSIRKDGSRIYVDGIFYVIPYGGEKAIAAIVWDMTERIAREHELRRAERLQGLARLSGGIAHNFNNLLMGIMGNASILKLTAQRGSDVFARASEIEELSQRGAALVNRLLTFAQRMSDEKIDQDLRNIVRESVSRFISEMKLPGSQVIIEQPREQVIVNVAKHAIETAIHNLLQNALEASLPGGKITVTVEKLNKHAVLSVTDKGRGISLNEAENLFDPFYSTKDPSKGAGLGLSMVYGIVNEHGGFVEFESDKARGSTFRIHLPLSSNPPAQEQPKGDMILIIERSDLVREMMSRILSERGYSVSYSPEFPPLVSGNLATNRVKLVILDLTISTSVDTSSLISEVRRLYSNCRIIGTSSNPSHESIINEGAFGFLLKPFNLTQFLDIIERATQ